MRNSWPTRQNTSGVKPSKVFVGLSGGVDSAVSAALLQKEGYNVTGVFIRIAIDGYPCTAGEDKISAMRAAAHLKIPFFEIDLSDEYKKRVFEVSVREFARGRTPNPDALCNREIKFGLFFEWCMSHGADMIATGHYAQTKEGQLFAGNDKNKDQSYFLWAVSETQLRKTFFPVGGLQKSEVRTLAATFNLPNAERPDSQGLCFLGPISMDEMLVKELRPTPGDVLDESGEMVGSHGGAVLYTLGQRHGFTLAIHTPESKPHFVIAKDVVHNTITVSINKFPASASRTEIYLTEVNWIGPSVSGPVSARYRYRQKLIPAELQQPSVLVTLSEPHYAPEGQSLVLYQGERCLGGGIVDRVELK